MMGKITNKVNFYKENYKTIMGIKQKTMILVNTGDDDQQLMHALITGGKITSKNILRLRAGNGVTKIQVKWTPIEKINVINFLNARGYNLFGKETLYVA